MSTTPYLMSIEPTGERSFLNGAHLGTNERIARQLCEERFHGRNKAGMPTATVALLDAKRHIVDVFDGEWSSQRGWED